MNYELLGLVPAIALAIGIYVLIEVGRKIGARRFAEEGEDYSKGIGALESAIFALLGLLLAFSFSGALTRFDGRRQLVVDEANKIGTAWLRIDLLPADSQPAMRGLFRQYLDSRLATYQKVPDMVAVKAELAQTAKLQSEIWSQAVPAATRSESPASTQTLFLGALNDMFDITTTRAEAARIHTPSIIFWMLGALAFACSLFAGYDMAKRKRRNVLHSLGFTIVLSVTLYVIIDLEYPRRGLVQVSDSDQVLVELRQSMK